MISEPIKVECTIFDNPEVKMTEVERRYPGVFSDPNVRFHFTNNGNAPCTIIIENYRGRKI